MLYVKQFGRSLGEGRTLDLPGMKANVALIGALLPANRSKGDMLRFKNKLITFSKTQNQLQPWYTDVNKAHDPRPFRMFVYLFILGFLKD